MAFDGSEGTNIRQDVAQAMTKRYRATTTHPDQTLGVFLGEKILHQLLQQDGCVGIRFYFGLSEGPEPELQLVAVGADANEDDQLGDKCIIADEGKSSPPHSGVADYLNSDVLLEYSSDASPAHLSAVSRHR